MTRAKYFHYASDDELLKVLKAPFTEGPLRETILRAFGLKYKISFENNLWKFVDWAASKQCTRKLNLQ